MAIILYICLILMLIVLIKAYYDTNYFKINNVEFKSERLPKGSKITIMQISDLHNKVFGKQNEPLLRAVRRMNADIIVITGDLIDRHTNEFKDVFTLIEQLVALNKHVYFVSGNHEWGNARTHEFFSGLEQRQVMILDNKSVQITKKNGGSLNLVGIANYSTAHHNLQTALEGIRNDCYTILLSHSPDIIEKFSVPPVDLILSGHTHGGQVRFPFIGALVVPDQGLFPKYDKGVFELGEDQFLYIDSGLGTSNLPIRFLNQSQTSLITIKANQ